jgi:hypothetical protein
MRGSLWGSRGRRGATGVPGRARCRGRLFGDVGQDAAAPDRVTSARGGVGARRRGATAPHIRETRLRMGSQWSRSSSSPRADVVQSRSRNSAFKSASGPRCRSLSGLTIRPATCPGSPEPATSLPRRQKSDGSSAARSFSTLSTKNEVHQGSTRLSSQVTVSHCESGSFRRNDWPEMTRRDWW